MNLKNIKKLLICILVVSLCLLTGCNLSSTKQYGICMNKICNVDTDYGECAIGHVQGENYSDWLGEMRDYDFTYEKEYADYYFDRSDTEPDEPEDAGFTFVFDKDTGTGMAWQTPYASLGMSQSDTIISRTRDFGKTWELLPYHIHFAGVSNRGCLLDGEVFAVAFDCHLYEFQVILYSDDLMSTFTEIIVDRTSAERIIEMDFSFDEQNHFSLEKMPEIAEPFRHIRILSLERDSVVVGFGQEGREEGTNYCCIVRVNIKSQTAETIFRTTDRIDQA